MLDIEHRGLQTDILRTRTMKVEEEYGKHILFKYPTNGAVSLFSLFYRFLYLIYQF